MTPRPGGMKDVEELSDRRPEVAAEQGLYGDQHPRLGDRHRRLHPDLALRPLRVPATTAGSQPENIYQVQTDYAPQENGDDPNLQMSSYVAGLAIARDFPQVESRVYLLPNIATVIRGGQALAVRDAAMVDGPSSTSSLFRSSMAIRAPRSACRGRWCFRERGAAPVRPGQSGRRDADRGGQWAQRRSPRRRGDARSAAQLAHAPRHADPLRSGQPFRRQPRLLHRLGLAAGWVYVALRPGSAAEEIHRQMPAWEARNILQSPISAPSRIIGLSAWPTSTWARRRTAARCAATTAPPSRPC